MENPASESAASAGLQPLPGVLNLLATGESAGYCADGVCHLPSTPAEKAE